MITFEININNIKMEKAINALCKVDGVTTDDFFKMFIEIEEDLVAVVEGLRNEKGITDRIKNLFGQDTLYDLLGILD